MHELANLLDGSLRNVGLVLSRLRSEAMQESEKADDANLMPRLQTANQAMTQMAMLIERWRTSGPDASATLHEVPQTLGQAAKLAARLLMPAAEAAKINLTVCFSDQAAQLPAGPVYTVIANALRNSIEAISQDTSAGTPADTTSIRGQIELLGEVRDGWTVLTIRDSGPGIDPSLADESGRFRFGRSTKPNGHGVGLALSRDIAISLGGSLHVTNVAPRGTCVTVKYPASGPNPAV